MLNIMCIRFYIIIPAARGLLWHVELREQTNLTLWFLLPTSDPILKNGCYLVRLLAHFWFENGYYLVRFLSQMDFCCPLLIRDTWKWCYLVRFLSQMDFCCPLLFRDTWEWLLSCQILVIDGFLLPTSVSRYLKMVANLSDSCHR
jgi:hypothetical protein